MLRMNTLNKLALALNKLQLPLTGKKLPLNGVQLLEMAGNCPEMGMQLL